METFDLTLDYKITTWRREQFEVQANSIEEAIEKIKDNPYNSPDCELWNVETFDDFDDYVLDKNGEPIMEIMNDKHEIVYSNLDEN